MPSLRIEVSGDATIYRPAERAVLSISIRSEGKTQEEVSKDVSITSAQLRDLFSGLAGKDDKGHALATAPITNWSNSTLSTWSYMKHGDSSVKKGTRVHEASMTFEAKFRDFARLGSVAMSLSTMKFVSISSINWNLTDKTKQSITAQCRHQAVHDAIAKAKDYAAALDRPAPPVVEIRDSDASSSDPMAMRYVAARNSSGGGDLSFAPEDVSLQCSVLVIFEDK